MWMSIYKFCYDASHKRYWILTYFFVLLLFTIFNSFCRSTSQVASKLGFFNINFWKYISINNNNFVTKIYLHYNFENVFSTWDDWRRNANLLAKRCRVYNTMPRKVQKIASLWWAPFYQCVENFSKMHHPLVKCATVHHLEGLNSYAPHYANGLNNFWLIWESFYKVYTNVFLDQKIHSSRLCHTKVSL